MPTRHHMALALRSFVADLAARHFGPSLWVAGKRWLGRKLFPSVNS